MIITLTIRYIPSLTHEADRIIKSQRLRGINFDSRNLKEKIISISGILMPMFMLSIQKSEKAADTGGVIHCFSYEKEMAKIYLDLGFYIGIGGVLTFKNARKLKEIVQCMPLERMLLETDCPYLAPVPFRGQRNDSSMLKYVVSAAAEITQREEEEIIRVTTANAKAMYRLDQSSSFSGTEKIRTEFPDR